MAVFNIGDQVAVLDETISGMVKAKDGDVITLVTSDGFTLKYATKELVKVEGGINVTNFEAAQGQKAKELTKKKPIPVLKPKERNAPKMEVDLHVNQLVKSTKGLSNFEMLNLQLESAKRQLHFAMDKRIQKVIFIHGVGEGVLKEELYYLFRKYDNIKFYDADYQKYGLGATEVYIYQNS
ncbi:DNA mismatch repair protein MutS [Flagellimonas aquimarina]|uniref:DNA mismatch repair protein MutS n=1 Tax=Flagellimonas aquimarina TaxID=2201895 RepID=A0A316KYC7_9FLAO|nr:Smr/MutS family protein [Allomuricauda koreensis]PWL39192.1 DNA mismatch repair protein MutS [Allomuricauda koreensis]